MREWLTVIIVLLIVAVVLDGLRRMRLSRRSNIRMSNSLSSNLNQQDPAAVDDIKEYRSELPGGGARVVNVRKAEDATERNSQIKQSAEYKRKSQLKSFRIPEQVSLNLDQQVPTLMESVAETVDESHDEEASYNLENYEIESDGQSASETKSEDIADFQDDERIEPIFATDDFDETLIGGPSESEAAADTKTQSNVKNSSVASGRHNTDNRSSAEIKPKKPQPVIDPIEDVAEEEIHYREPELVLTINVMAPKGEYFAGAELLDIILNQGMRFGAMNIFHRHEQADGDGEILYSMANIVVPGTFELTKMKTFSTPGVSFFLTLPMDANSTEAFEDMLTTAKIIGARMRGELKDENRSVLTPQTITHYRSKLQEFARKQLSKAPA